MEKYQYYPEKVQGSDHSIQEEIVSYCCPRAQKVFLILDLKDSFRILRLLPRTLSTGPETNTFS